MAGSLALLVSDAQGVIEFDQEDKMKRIGWEEE